MTDAHKSRPVIRTQSTSQRHFRRDEIRRNFSIEAHIDEELQQKTQTQTQKDAITTNAHTDDTPTDDTPTRDNSSPVPEAFRSSTQSSCSFSQKSPPHKMPSTYQNDTDAVPSKNTQTTGDPALLDVRKKVQRFETMRAEDRIIFKTGQRLKPPRPAPNPKPLPNPKPMRNSRPVPNPKPMRDSRPLPNPKPLPKSKPTPNPKPAPNPKPTPNPKPVPAENSTSCDTTYNRTLRESDSKTKANTLEEDEYTQPILRRKETFAWRVPIRPTFETPEQEDDDSVDEFSSSSDDADDTNVEAVKTWDSWKTLMAILKCEKDNEYLFNEMLNAKYEKSIQHIINEIISTEETYVENLQNGIANYGSVCERDDAPMGLRAKKSILFGNIEQITAFQRDEFLPMLRRNRRSPKRVFDEFYNYISDDRFYNYVVYTMNQQRSLELYELHQEYFKQVQSDLRDKLGINSFLLQPIQRMPRYLLLVQNISTLDNRQINSYGEFFKLYDGHHYTQDDLCMLLKEIQLMFNSSIRLEKKVQKLLTTINESHAVNDIVDVNMLKFQGKFHKADEFTVSSHPLKFSYRSKVFLFDKNIIYTKIKGSQLIFKGCFPCDTVGIFNQSKSFTLFSGSRRSSDPQECRFSGEPLQVQEWSDLIGEIQEQLRKTPSHDSGIFGLDE